MSLNKENAAAHSRLSMADVTILFGSQTGCAHDLAERLRRQGRARRFRTALFCMDEYGLVRRRRRRRPRSR